jgi:transglutaminase-like putative cysteine protease
MWEAHVETSGGGRPLDGDAMVGAVADGAARSATDVPSLIEAIVASVSRALVYDEREACPGRPLLDALARGRGVCQDYAHLAIAALEKLGLRARYVAGYVPALPRSGGMGTSLHAWIAVQAPGHGWIHADPTAGSLACERYVVCAVGRSYWETTPVMGALDNAVRVVRQARVAIEELD